MNEHKVNLGKPDVIVLENGRLVIKDNLALKHECEKALKQADKFGEALISFPFYKGGRQLKLIVKTGEEVDLLVRRIKEGLYEFSPFPNSSPYVNR